MMNPNQNPYTEGDGLVRYAGLPSNPTLVAATCPHLMKLRSPQQFRHIGRHRIVDLWNEKHDRPGPSIRARILEVVRNSNLVWHAIDLLRIGPNDRPCECDGREDGWPVTLFITVEPKSAKWEDAHAVAVQCRRMLRLHGIRDIECEVKEGEFITREHHKLGPRNTNLNAVPPEQRFEKDGRDYAASLHPWISPRDDQSEHGGKGLYLRLRSDWHEDKIVLLTSRQVVFPRDDVKTGKLYQYGEISAESIAQTTGVSARDIDKESLWRKNEVNKFKVIQPRNPSDFAELRDRRRPRAPVFRKPGSRSKQKPKSGSNIDYGAAGIDLGRSQAVTLEGEYSGVGKDATLTYSVDVPRPVETPQMALINFLEQNVRSRSYELGHVLLSPKFGLCNQHAHDPWVSDWALVELRKDAIPSTKLESLTNTVFLRPSLRWREGGRTFNFPEGTEQYVTLQDTVPENELFRQRSEKERLTLGICNPEGTSYGISNEVVSILRRCVGPEREMAISYEWAIIGVNLFHSFARETDFGAFLWVSPPAGPESRSDSRRIAGMVTACLGNNISLRTRASECPVSDVTYATPVERLLKHIESCGFKVELEASS
jgi:hypothetical protein